MTTHIYYDHNAFMAFCVDYGIDIPRTRICTSTRTCEVIPNVFILWR